MALLQSFGVMFRRPARFRRESRRRSGSCRLHWPLRLEWLEDRSLPTTLTVTTASDVAGHAGTSLRDAVSQANKDAGAGVSDTIVFASSLAGATITLTQGQLELSGHAANGAMITMDGSSLGQAVTVNGNNGSRVFQVDSSVQAAFVSLVITGGNRGNDAGGGILNSGTLTVNQSILASNNAAFGGGLANMGTALIQNSTITANTAVNYGDGGGIFNGSSAALMVSGSTFTFNDASNYYDGGGGGGGIYTHGNTLVINSTFFKNSTGSARAGNFGDGGAINGGAAVVNCTIYQNSASGPTAYDYHGAGNGGGLYYPALVVNTIVAGNTGTGSGGPGVPTELQQQVFPSVYGSHSVIGGNPQLGSLANNGGPTQTLALLPGSPASGAGGAVTMLAVGVNATSTTITVPFSVPSGAVVPTPIQIDNEQMLVTSAAGSLLTVTRGYNGTKAAAHDINASVYPATDQRGAHRLNPPDIGAYQASPSSFYIAVGTSNGHVQIRKTTSGALLADFQPFGAGYVAGVNVAEGDISGTGVKDLVVAAAAGNPNVKVYDGAAIVNGTFNAAAADNSLLVSFFPYALQFNVGATVAVGDVNGDGYGDLITGADVGNPDVRVYSGKDIANHTFNPTGASLLAQWFAYGLNFNVGANVAAGDLSGNGFADVVTGATAGNPDVHVYSGKAIANGTFNSSNPDASIVAQAFPFALQFNVGAYVAVGDVNGDGHVDLITGSSIGNPEVKTYDGKAIANGSLNADTAESNKLDDFFAFDLGMNIGVTVGSVDVDGSGHFDILTGPMAGSADLRIFPGTASGNTPPAVLDVPLPGLPEGVFVAA
jgi:hypothetical protein